MYPIQNSNFSISSTVRAAFHNCTYRKGAHIHQMLELIYIIEGKTIVKTRGKRTIAKAGDLVLIHPYQPHGIFTNDGQTVKLWMLVFSGFFIMDIIKNEISYKDYQNAVFTPSEELRSFIETKMFDTGEKSIELKGREILGIKALLYPIFDEYTRKVPIIKSDVKVFTEVINATLIFLQKNFFKDVSIDDCAVTIGYSKSHIAHTLSKTLDTTFLNLRNSFRINYAKTLLLTDDMSVFSVGLECGFNCEKSFERAFKKIVNMTPKKYKKLASKTN